MTKDLPTEIDLVVRGLTHMRTRSLIALRTEYRAQRKYKNDMPRLRISSMINSLLHWRRLAK